MTTIPDQPRRIVTGLRPNGLSCFARSEEVESVGRLPGAPELVEVYRMFAWDELPVRLPVDGTTVRIEGSPSAEETPEAIRRTASLPSGDGFRVSYVRFNPRPAGMEPKLEDYGAWHWHDTMVIQTLIAGELVMMLDDGSEKTLRPGDMVFQTGTNHAWDVRNEEGAVLAITVLPAVREGMSPPDHTRLVGEATPGTQ